MVDFWSLQTYLYWDRVFIDYDSIPAPTRDKLPTKEEIKAEYNAGIVARRDQFFLDHFTRGI